MSHALPARFLTPEGYVDLRRVRRFVQAVDIAVVARQFVKLTRRGTLLVGRCPRHRKRSESLVISLRHHKFHCFECGCDGGSVALLMHLGSLRWGEAIRHLELKFYRT